MPDNDIVARLVSALIHKVGVTFEYVDQDGITSVRTVNVLSLRKCANDSLVIEAFDLNRKAPRTFRVASIHQVAPSPAGFYLTVVAL